jgi:hypothetical protein
MSLTLQKPTHATKHDVELFSSELAARFGIPQLKQHLAPGQVATPVKVVNGHTIDPATGREVNYGGSCTYISVAGGAELGDGVDASTAGYWICEAGGPNSVE